MDDNLISKKALLEKYGISYGALYRWKRKGLIPEDWFIKTSTQTGQETFFPKEKIFERIDFITSHKDDLMIYEYVKKHSEREKLYIEPVHNKIYNYSERGNFDGRRKTDI